MQDRGHIAPDGGRNLERLMDRRIPLTASFSILEKRAKTIEEIVVLEVMREVYWEFQGKEDRLAS